MQGKWNATDPGVVSRARDIAKLVDNIAPIERDTYSLSRGIRYLAGMEPDVVPEIELSVAIGEKLGRSTAGLFMPTRLRASGLDTKSNAAGAYTVQTDVRDLIELLRNKMRVVQCGATVLSGLTSNVAFPVQATATTGQWMAQNSGTDSVDVDDTFQQKTLSPHIFQASTSFSRQLLAQSSLDVEALVRADIAYAHALALDAAAINGSGSSNQPSGILGTSGVNLVSLGTNGAAVDGNTIIQMEQAVSSANADVAAMRLLTSPAVRGKLREQPILAGSTSGIPAWSQTGTDGVGNVGGYDAFVSNQVPSNLVKGSSGAICSALIFGAWSSLVIAEFGVLEIIVDPYAKKRQGMIECTSFAMYDILAKYPQSFAIVVDALTT